MGSSKLVKRLVFFSIILMLSFSLLVIKIQKNSRQDLLNPVGNTNDLSQVMNKKIRPLLQKIPSDFEFLENTSSLIPKAEASEYEFSASALISVDLDTGKVLYEKDSEKRLPIASLTKIMTAVVALDLSTSSEYFTVSDYASRQIPTRIGVIPGEEMNLKELIHALLLTSANDAATVIQQGIDKKYGYPVFIKAMNEKAKFLGLTNTSFANPQGFDDPENFSTLADLTKLSKYALDNYPLINEIVKKDYEFLPADSHHKQFDLYNWNGLLGVYPSSIGLKIGNTGEAGKTTIVVSERDGKKILAAVLGAETIFDRDIYASQLLDIGYYATLRLPAVNITKQQLQDKYNSWEYFQ